jgi:hypothetical protein
MTSRLTPIRRIEAKRLITHLLAHERFDAEKFAEILAAVMIYTPEVVAVAARCTVPHMTGRLTNKQVRSYLSQAAAHLRAVAGGKTDRRRSEAHASRLENIVASMDDAGKSSLPFPLGYPTAEDRNTEGLADDKKV